MNTERAPLPRLAKACIAAVLVAALLLVCFVLPAEYDIDPLGTGAAFGLLGLSQDAPRAIVAQQEGLHTDSVRFALAPFESVEYKYRLEQDASLLFDWQANGEVVFDFHAEPDGAEAGFAESFAAGRANGARGAYLAPFAGIHGWFWENRGTAPVVVELLTTGFYSSATEFKDGDARAHEVHRLGDVHQ